MASCSPATTTAGRFASPGSAPSSRPAGTAGATPAACTTSPRRCCTSAAALPPSTRSASTARRSWPCSCSLAKTRRYTGLSRPSMSIAEFSPASIVADPRPKRWTRKEFDQLVKLGFFDQSVELVDGEILRSRPGTYDDPHWLWTREAFYRLWDLGFLADMRVQLLEGEIYFMLPQNPPHASSVARVSRLLERAFGGGYHVRVQLPLACGALHDPEPDIAVVVGEPDDYAQEHPRTATLIVEVSDS